ncbi:Secreted subtilisin-like serine protease sub4 [Lobosporangium transversale]|nr:Secreted subtilisin-like serine protease sub4 [Lobosporangium transversale]
MKVLGALSVPLLLIPFTQAADYLVRFKEGGQRVNGVSRVQTFAARPFDYNAKELSITVLSPTQAKSIVQDKNGSGSQHHHGKSKAQVEPGEILDGDNNIGQAPQGSNNMSPIQIRSKGRWFTFNDDQFHVWHGDFSEEEVELLAKDDSVEIVERDIEIRFPELKVYNKKSIMADKVKHLENAYDAVDEQMTAMELKNIGNAADDAEQKTPVSHIGNSKPNKKIHHAKEYVPTVSAEDIPGPKNAYMIQQDAPSWGLPRVSQRKLPLSADYHYPNSAGEGVDVYVIDTGININHVDFEGRARWGTTTVPGGPDTDDNGHGTFVAGVIGSRTFGVAKKVNLIAVKGLDREGTSTLSQILAALDWVIKQNSRSTNHRNVVNLSLGAGYSKVLNAAIDMLVQSGLFIVAAAGNGNERNIGQDACNYSPASAPTAFTVGSTNIRDQISPFSNYGQCVNIYAPGERVRSTWIGPTNREVYTDSGTSFSAPNVAGIAALIMGSEQGDRSDGSWSPKNIGNRILQLGTRNVIRNFKGPANTNLLAFNGAGIVGVSNTAPDNGDNQNSGPDNNDDNSNDGHSISSASWPPAANDNVSSPRSINRSPTVSSTTNHCPALSAIQLLTIFSTVGSTAFFLISF